MSTPAWGWSWGSSWGMSWGIPSPAGSLSREGYNIPQPEGLTFTEWTARVAEQLSQFGVQAALSDVDWKEWVCSLFYVQQLDSVNMPDPNYFETWQSWVYRFLDCLGVA